MGVSLKKGGNVSLSKEAPGLTRIHIGLSWDERPTDGKKYDLDVCLFMVGANGKVRSDADFIFYDNRDSADGSVSHKGDNRTGRGAGDDEVIKVDLTRLPADVQKLVVSASIHEADADGINFGEIPNPCIRIVNDATDVEIARYDLAEDSAVETAMFFGEIYRYGEEWKFRALGNGFAGGLGPLAMSLGVNIE